MPMLALTLWGYALAALLFGMLAAERARAEDRQLPRGPFVVALAATALWALAVAGIDARDVAARVAESIRNLAWLWFLFALVRHHGRAAAAASAAYLAVAFVSVTAAALAMIEAAVGPHADIVPLLTGVRVPLRMMAAVASLVLVHRLYLAVAPAARGGLRLALAAVAAIWTVDFLVYAVAWSAGSAPAGLVVARGVAMALVAPVFAVAVHRGGDWTFSPSRVAAFRSLSFVAVGIYLTAMVVASGAFAQLGGGYARALQTAFVAGAGASLVAVVASPWLRAWARVKLAKHLFSHRYDYRHEWTRFTATLGRAGEGAPALDVRVVQAIADLTDSAAGLLLISDREGLDVGAGWNWPGVAAAPPATAAAFARTLESSGGRIVELDSDRAGDVTDAPQWLLDEPQAWAVVPLIHLGKLAGAVVLARPPLARALDWEDFDLLKVAGSQAASYLAEARAVAALGDAQRFDEFNRRFAFIIHDVKNLVSQLTLVARNAERHADNPEFRADMVATLKDSCGRMNELLARLSQHHGGRPDPVRPAALLPLIEKVAARFRDHPVMVQGDAGVIASIDPARFEQLLGHLIQNATEASPANEPVVVAVSDSADSVAVAVIDRGCGMTPGFMRDSLFRPFASSKPGGFGIGAFEASQLATAMGGRIDVVSREGDGARFTVRFPHPRSLPLTLASAA